jgi:hypothetical protein
MTAIYYDGADTTERPQTLPQADWVTPRLLNCANVCMPHLFAQVAADGMF